MPPNVKAAAEEKARLDAIHAKHLAEMKPAVDNKPPPTYSHLGPGNGKAATLAAARQQEIDAGNARLLNNLTRIAGGGTSIDHGQGPQLATPLTEGRTLGSVAKKAEQDRIDAENQRLLGHLTSIAQGGGTYDKDKMAKDHDAHKAHVTRISRFPPK